MSLLKCARVTSTFKGPNQTGPSTGPKVLAVETTWKTNQIGPLKGT